MKEPAALTLLFFVALSPLAATAQTAPAHVSNTFRFTIPASLSVAAPFFGPEGERCWAGKHWDPWFLYPQPAKDVAGAVFTVQHARTTAYGSIPFSTSPPAGCSMWLSFRRASSPLWMYAWPLWIQPLPV